MNLQCIIDIDDGALTTALTPTPTPTPSPARGRGELRDLNGFQPFRKGSK